MGLAEFPEQATTLLLNQTRKRGRPQNNTAALIRQPSEAYSQKGITFQASSASRKTNSYLEFFFYNRNNQNLFLIFRKKTPFQTKLDPQ